MLKVLSELNRRPEPVTAAELRASTRLPKANISTALIRLAEEGVLLITPHPTATYTSHRGEQKPRLLYQLSEKGSEWAREVFAEHARRPTKAWTWVALPGDRVIPAAASARVAG